MAASTGAPPTRAGGAQTRMQTPSAPSITTTTAPQQAVLHLRGAMRESEELDDEGSAPNTRTRRRIQWAEDVIDNEGMGKKSSKVCCIYHAPKGIDESSDESSSDSDDSESDSGDDGAARPARKEGHSHGHGHNHGHSHGKGTGKGKGRARSPNAYEKQPKVKNGGGKEKG